MFYTPPISSCPPIPLYPPIHFILHFTCPPISLSSDFNLSSNFTFSSKFTVSSSFSLQLLCLSLPPTFHFCWRQLLRFCKLIRKSKILFCRFKIILFSDFFLRPFGSPRSESYFLCHSFSLVLKKKHFI